MVVWDKIFNDLEKNKPKNVFFEGFITDLHKRLQKAIIGIAPIKTGSGSRVKILDYLSNGLHVISSKVGALGLEDIHEVINISDDINEYKNLIKTILKTKEINKKGLKAIKKYSFETQGKIASRIIKKINNNL